MLGHSLILNSLLFAFFLGVFLILFIFNVDAVFIVEAVGVEVAATATANAWAGIIKPFVETWTLSCLLVEAPLGVNLWL